MRLVRLVWVLALALAVGSGVPARQATSPAPAQVATRAPAVEAPRALPGTLVLGGSAGLESHAPAAFLRKIHATDRGQEEGLAPVVIALGAASPSERELRECFGESAFVLRLAGEPAGSALVRLRGARAVWVASRDESAPPALALDGELTAALAAVLQAGGVVGAAGAGARALGANAAGLLPDLVVRAWGDGDSDGGASDDGDPPALELGAQAAVVAAGRILRAAPDPDRAPDERRAGRRFRVRSEAGDDELPHGTYTFRDGELVVDRPAIVRALRARPVAPTEPVGPPAGSLFLAGGGRLPEGLLERFVQAAGGDSARVVVLVDALREEPPVAALLRRAGAGTVTVSTPPEALGDGRAGDRAEVARALAGASGAWIAGGRGFRLVDAWLDTGAHAELEALLARGGAVGGASAGAAMLADRLTRGGPFDNREVAVAGYDRGFGFLRGCAVDTHFGERSRFPDLLALKRAEPLRLGIGIDERTALLVDAEGGEVFGAGGVTLLSGREAPADPAGAARRLVAGERFAFAEAAGASPPPEGPDQSASDSRGADSPLRPREER